MEVELTFTARISVEESKYLHLVVAGLDDKQIAFCCDVPEKRVAKIFNRMRITTNLIDAIRRGQVSLNMGMAITPIRKRVNGQV